MILVSLLNPHQKLGAVYIILYYALYDVRVVRVLSILPAWSFDYHRIIKVIDVLIVVNVFTSTPKTARRILDFTTSISTYLVNLI